MIDMDKILETGAKVVDSAKNLAAEVAKEGKKQADLLAAQNRLAKKQRQLGILVYNLAKGGEENQALVNKYIAAIAAVESEINDLRAAAPDQNKSENIEVETVVYETESGKTCPQCGAEVKEDAAFCSCCGGKL